MRSRGFTGDEFGRDPFELTQEERELQNRVDDVIDELQPDDHAWEEDERFPWEAVATLADHGLLSLTYPADLGGSSASRMDAVLVLERLARRSFTLAETAQLALNGPSYLLTRWGSTELVHKYVRPVAAGKAMIAIAITELEAGSDLGKMATSFRKDGDEIVVDGHKAFVSAGPLASAALVVGRFGGTGSEGIGAVVVPTDAEGVTIETVYSKIGGNAVSEAAFRFDAVRVPSSHILIDGPPVGREGLRRVLHSYNALRLGIAAICLGVADGAVTRVAKRLTTREQFGQPLADFQGLQWRFARLSTDLEQARLLTYRSARRVDEDGLPSAAEAAMAKLAASEVALEASSAAVQTMGWRGVVRGPDHPDERVLREVRGWTIAGGPNETLLTLIGKTYIRRYAAL